jgi:hypothetical protein
MSQPQTLAERIEALRQPGESKGKFSLRLGWARTRYTALQAGLARGQAIGAEVARQIADGTGARVEWVLYGTGQPYADGRPLPARVSAHAAPLLLPELDEPGRWRRYAQRYATFAAAARLVRAAGSASDAVLDLAADRLGEHKGDGPTLSECRRAIGATLRDVDLWSAQALRDATDEDFEPEE